MASSLHWNKHGIQSPIADRLIQDIKTGKPS